MQPETWLQAEDCITLSWAGTLIVVSPFSIVIANFLKQSTTHPSILIYQTFFLSNYQLQIKSQFTVKLYSLWSQNFLKFFLVTPSSILPRNKPWTKAGLLSFKFDKIQRLDLLKWLGSSIKMNFSRRYLQQLDKFDLKQFPQFFYIEQRHYLKCSFDKDEQEWIRETIAHSHICDTGEIFLLYLALNFCYQYQAFFLEKLAAVYFVVCKIFCPIVK